ncbi:MAG: L,D-transpeptidase [Rhodospirillaceae bacterium]
MTKQKTAHRASGSRTERAGKSGPGIALDAVASVLAQKEVPRSDIQLLAELHTDGKAWIIDVAPCADGPVYRVAKKDVIVGQSKMTTCTDGRQKKIHHITVRGDADGMRWQAGKARDLFGLDPLGMRPPQYVRIAFTSSGEGTLTYGGTSVPCLGRPGFGYRKDLTITGVVGIDKFRERWSTEYGVMMEWAVLIMGQRGIYVHLGADTIATNYNQPSAGCIHLAGANASRFYDWITGTTRFEISCPWAVPGRKDVSPFVELQS